MLPIQTLIIAVIFLALYGLFLLWYGGRGKPLTEDEIETFLAEIRARAGGSNEQPEPILLTNLRALTAKDDGRAFYMVNLMRFRKQAAYPADSGITDADALAANARYNRAIIPLLLKRAGHPLFAGRVRSRFLHPDGADDWHQVAIVRYRSRRDMLKTVVELTGKNVDSHKWAALEKTQVFPVSLLIPLVAARLIAAVGVIGVAAFVMALVAWL